MSVNCHRGSAITEVTLKAGQPEAIVLNKYELLPGRSGHEKHLFSQPCRA